MSALQTASQCRPLEEGDVTSLLQFLPATLPGNWTRDSLLQSAWEQRVFSLGSDNEPRGYAEFYIAADECHLLAIAIAPSCQGRGYGSQLLAAVLAEATARGCSACLLEVRASNQAAKGLYEKAGFEQTGMRKAYYQAGSVTGLEETGREVREDALLYSLPLPPSS